MTTKYTNHLANRTDKLAKKGQGIPHYLALRFTKMQKYTEAVRIVFQKKLPLADFNRCFVTNVEVGCMTISVDNHTFANHFRYISNQYLQELKQHSQLFSDINQIKVITTNHYN